APAQMKMAYAASDLPSRSSRQAYEYVLAENSVENYQEFIRIYPHDPMSDRIRILLGNLLQAKAWHHAVQTNSPVAYKSFYEKFSNGPYAQSALKMAAQPKIIPLSQPTRILAPASIKLGGFGPAKGHFGGSPGAPGFSQGGGKIVTLPSPGAKPTLGKPTLGKHGGETGKIVSMPPSRVGKMGERPAQKLDGKLGQVEKRTTKSQPLVGVDRGPAKISNAGNGHRAVTSSQFRGSFGQAPAGRGFKTMR
ncbi:MAG: hypothetical protein Q8K88_03010, partial [Bradyrhizobium sp.]|nr:hypothetical protein [Bradyrhizobium sp.]